MAPQDDLKIAAILSPLVSRAESLHRQADALAAEIVTLEQELRKILSVFSYRRAKGGGK